MIKIELGVWVVVVVVVRRMMMMMILMMVLMMLMSGDEWWWFGLDHHDSTTYNVLVVTSFGSSNPDKVEDLDDTKNEEMADDERKIQLQPYER